MIFPRRGNAIVSALLILSFCASSESKDVPKNLTIETVGMPDQWESFRNNKNHFEFKKPACLRIGTSDPDNEAAESNVVQVLSGTTCGNGYEMVMELNCLDTAPVYFDRVLENKENIVRREMNLNGTKAVIKARRTKQKHCATWTVHSRCNSKNLSIIFSQCMGKKEFEALENGVGEPGPVIKAMIESFKCLKD